MATPREFDRHVGRNLQLLRKAAGLSQAELAARLADRGLHFQQPTVLKVERGSRPLKFEEAFAAAQILGVRVADLFGSEEDTRALEARRSYEFWRTTVAIKTQELEGAKSSLYRAEKYLGNADGEG